MAAGKNLTPESFDQLLNALSPDRREAAAAYAKLRDALVRFFQLKGDFAPETAADATLDRVAVKISESVKIDNLTRYSFGVARFIFLERLHSRKKEKIAAEGFYTTNNLQKNPEESDDFSPFRECFEGLPRDENILMQTYFADLSYEKLIAQRQESAKQYNISLENLRLKIFRLRRRLNDCVRRKLGK
jgi:DNA-directed RNA polymerase specialized sigma24 family protein